VPEEGASPAGPITVLVVSDIRFYLEGLALALGQNDRLRVAATAATADAAVRLAAQVDPLVALIDAGMASAGSLPRQLRVPCPELKLVSMAVRDNGPDVAALAELGYHAYVTREDSVECLVLAVQRAVLGELACSLRVGGFLMAAIGALASGRSPAAGDLTSRELEILDLVAAGLTNKEVARRLYIELSTVKNHLHNAFEKLQVKHRAEAASWVLTYRRGRLPRGPTPGQPEPAHKTSRGVLR
jgi:DNA-binding NarL/FixJ family response regulator